MKQSQQDQINLLKKMMVPDDLTSSNAAVVKHLGVQVTRLE